MSTIAVEILRGALKQSHGVLEGTMADVSNEALAWQPAGVANSIGTNYGHIVTGEDFLVNVYLRKGAPMLASSWAGKTGLSELPPTGGGLHEWGQRVQIDLAALRAYAQAVYANTDEYLASLNDEELATTIEIQNFGPQTIGGFMGSFVLANLNWHTGEIAALKGIQGLKGYPF